MNQRQQIIRSYLVINHIEELAKKDPFTPYKLIMTNGNAYEVLSPLMVAVGQSEIAYFFPKSDRMAHLRLNQLSEIEIIEPKP